MRAIQARCTVGEISEALEKVWGRYQASHITASGVYRRAHMDETFWSATEKEITQFEKKMAVGLECLLRRWGKMDTTAEQK